MGGFQSRDTFNSWRSTPNGNTVNESSEIFIISIELMFSCKYMQSNEICSLSQDIKRQLGKVDLQAFSYVLVLSETHLLQEGHQFLHYSYFVYAYQNILGRKKLENLPARKELKSAI